MNWYKPNSKRKHALVLASILLFSFNSIAQSKIEVIQADELVFTERLGIEAQRLIGNVIFKHQNALMYCDSAYLYRNTNAVDAFGSVRINQEDTLNLYGDKLNYNGETQLATVTGKEVRLIGTNFDLLTDKLIYDRKRNVADYYTGAIINSKKDSNKLSSKIGHYFANQQQFNFKDSVVLENPNFIMHSDTLHYYTVSGIVNFLGPTTITGDSNFIYCENGWYNTKTDQSKYFNNAYLITDGRKLSGDTLFYDRKLGYGNAINNISVLDTAENIELRGAFGEVFESKDSAVISKRPLLIQLIEGDSLFMRADTFKVFKNKAEEKFMMAYHDVLIFKSDLQGKCDSVSYVFSDSVIEMHREPILWSEENQLTGEFVSIKIVNQKMHSIFLDQNAFVISQVDSLRYNQVKGKTMTGYFKDSELRTIKVRGNGQSTYFGQDEQKRYIGVNVAESSDMNIHLKDSGIHSISFLKDPDASMHPLDELDPVNDLRYKGFKWLNALRPKKISDLDRDELLW